MGKRAADLRQPLLHSDHIHIARVGPHQIGDGDGRKVVAGERVEFLPHREGPAFRLALADLRAVRQAGDRREILLGEDQNVEDAVFVGILRQAIPAPLALYALDEQATAVAPKSCINWSCFCVFPLLVGITVPPILVTPSCAPRPPVKRP